MANLRAEISGRVIEDRGYYMLTPNFDVRVREYRTELFRSSGLLKLVGNSTIDRVSIDSAEVMLRKSLETDRIRMFREMLDAAEEV